MDFELNQNLARIIRTLEGQGMKPTKIAHAIGYTTTRQLYNSVDGKSLLSTKAVKGLIENLNVNPIYLFLGKGDMFLTAEAEIETLRKENQEWIQKHNEAVKTIMVLNEIINKLEKRNEDLIELSSDVLKYYKEQKHEDQAKGEKDLKDPLTTTINFLRWLSKDKKEEMIELIASKDPAIANIQYLEYMKTLGKKSTKEEIESSVKQDKK